ncbi:MAG TPA: twin-arginine translocation signal domain-containing protein [Desulfopila sp.]|nr:twin-arginine translocation signal domain-containing protein [Desulfopila sp.]
MEKDQDKRRSFLKHILAGAAVVAGSVAAIKPARARKTAAVTHDGDETCYQESENFKKYYDSLKS